MALNPPTNVLTANAGGGCVHVIWTAPVAGDTPDGYDVYVASSESGTYYKVNYARVSVTHYIVRNFLMDANDPLTLYTKVKSRNTAGDDTSDFSAVARDGTLAKPTATLTFAGPTSVGISAGSIWGAEVRGQFVAFAASASGSIS